MYDKHDLMHTLVCCMSTLGIYSRVYYCFIQGMGQIIHGHFEPLAYFTPEVGLSILVKLHTVDVGAFIHVGALLHCSSSHL